MIDNVDDAQFIVERGVMAKSLLDNEAFTWIVNDQSQYHLAALIAAPPGPSGADAVSYHHLQQYALTELVATLQGYAAAGEEQLAMIEMADPEDTTDARD